MWFKMCILALCGIYSARSVEITPRKAVFSVAAGSHLQVNCSSPNGVQWSSEPSSAMNEKSLNQGSVAGSDNISTLTFESVQESNQATYRCTDTSTRDDVSFQLRVFTVSKQEALYEYKADAVLHCNVQDSRNFTYTWKKGDTAVSKIKVDSKQQFVMHDNGTLEIKNPPRSFAGVYTCEAAYTENDVTSVIDIDVPYYAHPKVIPFDKSKNLVQDEKLVVECKVLGYPKPTISWYKGGEEIKGEAGSRYKLSAADTYDSTMIDNAKLEIDAVDFDDAGEYKCMATQSKWQDFNSTQVIMVRVKDKLAALWPFLGIVAEVVVLCAIIFIYEKKRSKDVVVDEDVNEEGASPKKQAEGVRHRGSPNNPRA